MNLRRLISCTLIAQTRSFPSPVSGREERSSRLHTTRHGSRAVCAVIALTLAPFSWAVGAQAEATHTIIAASGAAAPAGGNYVFLFTDPALNARGQVAFDAILGGPSTTGVFVNDGRTTSAIALGGDPDPDAGNFSIVFAPSITTRGDVIFNTFDGVFRSNGRTTLPLVQNGDAAPGGGSLTLSSLPAANARGNIAYLATVTGGDSTQGVFRNDGSQTVAIARDNTLAPTGGTFIFFAEPVIDKHDRVAFFAGMTGSTDFGIFRGDGEQLTTIFAANESAPGGATFLDFSDPVINKNGEVLAVALLQNGTSDLGLFLGNGMNAVAIALSGDAAPKGGSYNIFFGPLILNDRGQAAFEVFLTGGSSRSGIFRGDGVETTPIALQGTAAPGTTGTFDSFQDMKMGEDGTVAFIATLTLGVGGVDTSNNMGIWIGTSDQDLDLVVRTGQIIAEKTLTRLESLGQLEMNDGPVVWRGRFSGASTAIVSSDP